MASNWGTPPIRPPSPEPRDSEIRSRPVEELVRPPVAYLIAAIICVLVSLALFVPGGLTSDAVGYLLGGVAVTCLVMGYRFVDQKRRQEPTYSPATGLEALALTLLAVGLLSALIHLWLLATELSK